MDYPSNSHKSKQKEELMEVTNKTGKVTVHEEPLHKELLGSVVSMDVTLYTLWRQVIAPALKRLISDTVNLYLFDGKQPARTNGGNVRYDKVYVSSSNQTNYNNQTYPSVKAKNRFNPSLVTFEDRADAENVLYKMELTLAEYDVVKVSDFCQFAGITNPDYTREYYGWTNLDGVRVERTPMSEWHITLPTPYNVNK